jgi:hypothetical protein
MGERKQTESNWTIYIHKLAIMEKRFAVAGIRTDWPGAFNHGEAGGIEELNRGWGHEF